MLGMQHGDIASGDALKVYCIYCLKLVEVDDPITPPFLLTIWIQKQDTTDLDSVSSPSTCVLFG